MRVFLLVAASLGLVLAIGLSTRSAPVNRNRADFSALAQATAGGSGTAQVMATAHTTQPVVLRVEKNRKLVLERTFAQPVNGEVEMGAIPVAAGDVLSLSASIPNLDPGRLAVRIMSEGDLRKDTQAILRNARLVFRDDFNGTQFDPSKSLWQSTNRQGARTHPTSPYTVYSDAGLGEKSGVSGGLNPFSEKDGYLTIKAGLIPGPNLPLVRSALGPKAPEDKVGAGSLRYYSGQLQSAGTWSQTYGYFEMRAKLPRGQGFWPAFWLTSTRGWPPEIDMLEAVFHEDTQAGVNQVHSALHFKALSPSGQPTGGEISTGVDTPVTALAADLYSQFHLYSASWDPEWINIYFDDRLIFRIATPAQMNSPMSLIADLQVGRDPNSPGNWPAEFNNMANLANSMQIDHIAAYLLPQSYAQIQPDAAGNLSLPATAAAKPGSIMTGDDRSNRFTTGDGIDLIHTGGGADQIIVQPGKDAHKVIDDFDPGKDKIIFNGFPLTSADILSGARQIGPDLWLTVSHQPQAPQTVILRNLRRDQLTESAISAEGRGAGRQRGAQRAR